MEWTTPVAVTRPSLTNTIDESIDAPKCHSKCGTYLVCLYLAIGDWPDSIKSGQKSENRTLDPGSRLSSRQTAPRSRHTCTDCKNNIAMTGRNKSRLSIRVQPSTRALERKPDRGHRDRRHTPSARTMYYTLKHACLGCFACPEGVDDSPRLRARMPEHTIIASALRVAP